MATKKIVKREYFIVDEDAHECAGPCTLEEAHKLAKDLAYERGVELKITQTVKTCKVVSEYVVT